MEARVTTDYRIRLDAFEGPLDLLLFLIRRAEVDVHDIPIATIADEFLDTLGAASTIDVDQAGEFLVMAATLMEIKSRMISREGLPAASESEERPGGEEEEDPRAGLVRQLLEYKRYRDAADLLEDRRREWERRYPVARAGIDRDAVREARASEEMLELEDIDLGQIVDAFARIIATVNFERLGDHAVIEDDTPVEVHAADLLDRLARDGTPASDGRPTLSLARLVEGRSRMDMIGLFLATLELVRRQRVSVRYDEPGGEIVLALARADGDVPA